MELQEALHKFERENAHMLRVFDEASAAYDAVAPTLYQVELALAQAKRVRAASTVLVRALATERDKLQPSEGHKHD
jgi:hypothetical protein